jgi:GNAT superfamily N-acetyltransferase
VTSEVAVRVAAPGDADAVASLVDELDDLQRPWRVFTPRPGAKSALVERLRRAENDKDARLLVAEVGGRVVGTAFAHVVQPSTFSDERAVEVSAFVVSPTERGKGVGSALLAACARFARERGVGRLTLKTFAQNEASLDYWRRRGFRDRMVQLTASVDAVDGPQTDRM